MLISESTWEEMTCLFAPSLTSQQQAFIELFAEDDQPKQ
ncbi:hypothetical protein MZH51_23175 [Escherichia coli]|nr:hypothetical protein [Escherichia coli]